MTQAQTVTAREMIREVCLKIKVMLAAVQVGDDQVCAERLRVSREEDLYRQDVTRLEKDLSDLESQVEELRGNVINRRCRVNMSNVESMALVLSRASKTVADLKGKWSHFDCTLYARFPNLQDSLKTVMGAEMEVVVREEKFLKEEPERLENALRRCKKLTGTLVTLKRLASVQEQRHTGAHGLPEKSASADGAYSDGEAHTGSRVSQHDADTPHESASCNFPPFGNEVSNFKQSTSPRLLDSLRIFSRVEVPSLQDLFIEGFLGPRLVPFFPSPVNRSMSHSRNIPTPVNEYIHGTLGCPDDIFRTMCDTRGADAAVPLQSVESDASPASAGRSENALDALLDELQTFSKDKRRPAESPVRAVVEAGSKKTPPPPPPRTTSKSPVTSPTGPQRSRSEPVRTSALACEEGRRDQLSSNSSSSESVNSQEGLQGRSRQELLDSRHQELLRKQRQLQEQYARLQLLQRLSPPKPDLKKTGSESNILHKASLAMASASGSLTHLAI
ncbi:unnamed protein product, partial [Ixodes hexagonus]